MTLKCTVITSSPQTYSHTEKTTENLMQLVWVGYKEMVLTLVMALIMPGVFCSLGGSRFLSQEEVLQVTRLW